MDLEQARRYRKTSKDHTKHCDKCGLPSREGCKINNCNDVQHCACAMTQEK